MIRKIITSYVYPQGFKTTVRGSSMKIRMLESRRGSENGYTVKCYHAGGIYDVADSLARSFIRQGWAVAPGDGE